MDSSSSLPSARPSRRTVLAGGAAAAWAGPTVIGRATASAQTSPPPVACAPTLIPLLSPGAEAGVVPPWQTVFATMEASPHAVGVPGVGPVPPPPGGATSFFGETDSGFVVSGADTRASAVRQNVEIPASLHAVIDAGGAVADLSAWFAVGSESGAGLVGAQAFETEAEADSSPPTGPEEAIGLSPNEFGPDFQGPVGEWVLKSRTIGLPPGSRWLRVGVALLDRASSTPGGEIRAGVDVIQIIACP